MQDPSVERLLRTDLRIPVELSVSTYLGRTWRVTRAEGKTDEASHPAAILADERDAVFVKYGDGDLAVDQLTQEAAGLRLLTQRSGVLTPAVIGVIPVGGGALMVMAAVQVIDRGPIHWRQMGRTLAQIHRVKGERFGLETHCYWGSYYQDNRPLPEWPDFFWTRRIEPWLRAAVDSGRLPAELAKQVEQIGGRLAELCGPPVQPTLLHGDAHQNNFLSTAHGPVLIDPAVYYGHPEVDLAYVDFFAPVSDELFAGYQELTPIDPGFAERRDLWRTHAWLAMVAVDGPQHLERLSSALGNYV